MIVCVCHRVSDRDIARAAAEGCDSFDALQEELRVATQCGACHECALDTFHAHRGQVGAGAAVCGGLMPPARPDALAAVRIVVKPVCPPANQPA